MAVAGDEFKKAMKLWASGVCVVTTQSEHMGIQGMTVTAFSSVSVEPPQILVCLNDSAETAEGIQESQYFAVNVLNADQEEVSNQFAGGASQQQRFENTPWELAPSGVPMLSESLMSLECKVVERVRAGTHWIVIGEVQASVLRSGDPLLYCDGAYRRLAEIS